MCTYIQPCRVEQLPEEEKNKQINANHTQESGLGANMEREHGGVRV
jgi:hypothetical protein